MATNAEIQVLVDGIACGDGNTAAEVCDVLAALNDNGLSSQVFEYFLKNLGSYPMTNTFRGDTLTSKMFTSPNGDIVKTFGYDPNDDLITIALFGVGYPVFQLS